MTNFKIFCDGSYRNGKSGFGIKIINPKVKNVVIIAFGSEGASDSYESEILAVEKALILIQDYILTWLSDKDCEIQIYSDCKTIVDIFNKGKHKRIYTDIIKNSNIGDIKRNKLKLIELIKIVNSYPEGSIKFIKASGKDINLKLADKFAKFALNHNYLLENEFYFCEQNDMKKVLNLVTPLKTINNIDHGIVKKLIETEMVSKSAEVTYEESKASELVSSIFIPINKIIVSEDEHLDCKSLNFNGLLRKIAEDGEVKNPIFIRAIEGKTDRYILVSGAAYLFSAKILEIEKIPAIVTDFTCAEFKETYCL